MFNFLKIKNRKKQETPISATLLHKEPNFLANEAYKLLRTNIAFALPDTGKCRVIGITSSIRGEAKSTTAINLSYVLSQNGKRVLLLDGDLRLPSVAKKLEVAGAPGLSDALIDSKGDISAIKPLVNENWHFLPAGTIPPNPSEMLGSAQMEAYIKKLSESYDFIIVDLPPVNIVSDALVVSPLLDGMIVVVRCNYSEKRELSKCIKALELANVKILGLLMTAKRDNRPSYSRYKKYTKGGYYKSRYYNNQGKSYGKQAEAPVLNSTSDKSAIEGVTEKEKDDRSTQPRSTEN